MPEDSYGSRYHHSHYLRTLPWLLRRAGFVPGAGFGNWSAVLSLCSYSSSGSKDKQTYVSQVYDVPGPMWGVPFTFLRIVKPHSKSPRKKELCFTVSRWGKLVPLDWKVIKGLSEEMASLADTSRVRIRWKSFPTLAPKLLISFPGVIFIQVNFKSLFISTNKSKKNPFRNKSR